MTTQAMPFVVLFEEVVDPTLVNTEYDEGLQMCPHAQAGLTVTTETTATNGCGDVDTDQDE